MKRDGEEEAGEEEHKVDEKNKMNEWKQKKTRDPRYPTTLNVTFEKNKL